MLYTSLVTALPRGQVELDFLSLECIPECKDECGILTSPVGSAALVREIRGRHSSVKRRRICPTVFSCLYHGQWSEGNSRGNAWVAINFKSVWAMHKKTGQRRTPSPLRP